ncbi:MAG: type II toxin-antitoxin system RelE/ParE family toxin [Vicinamibacterales bacterium]
MAARVREVIWAESARDALDAVITYIAQDSQQAAVHVLEAALEAAASLSTLSERGRVVPETNDPAVRETFVFRYRLMYRVEPERVLVLAFLHGARDFATWRQGRDSL